MGGFGSAVAEYFVDRDQPPPARLRRYALADAFLHHTGGQATARLRGGLDANAISADIIRRLT